ncbi:hypothetical protein FUAX_44070 (plasmid) [Fulvitalea axinellae]|uniref:Peptidase M28 domain-containing protein n=1 Tax=Fulvitalea axinellae TaxID=1182444 RepID=A0AAU9CRG6_9BACT|nr:hypothetical protein FUAX_44070 [Fulvitalea axinellae]
MLKGFLSLVLSLTVMAPMLAQSAKDRGLEAITEGSVRGALEYLASDWFEGREVGRRGSYMAAAYIESVFKTHGLEPAGDDGSYFQKVTLTEYKPGEKQILSVIGNGKQIDFAHKVDFSVTLPEVGGIYEAPVVFVGYGMPDDFEKADVSGKVVFRLKGFPGQADTASVSYKKYKPAGARELRRDKDKMAFDAGAVAIVEFDPSKDITKRWASNLPFRVNGKDYEGDKIRESFYETKVKLHGDTLRPELPVATVSAKVANELVSGSGISLKGFAKKAESAYKFKKVKLGKSIRLQTSVDSEIVVCRNVIAKIQGKDATKTVAVGAHYDHLGKHDGYIWNGADDNASGVTAILNIAKAFKASGQQPDKTILFTAWTAEEKGLNGSEHFLREADRNGLEIEYYLNFDMIGRNSSWDPEGNKCMMLYTKAFPIFEETNKRNNSGYDLNLDVSYSRVERPVNGSDQANFARRDIPIFWFHTWGHPDYHQPTDHSEKINWDKIIKIIKVSYLDVWDLTNEGVTVQ